MVVFIYIYFRVWMVTEMITDCFKNIYFSILFFFLNRHFKAMIVFAAPKLFGFRSVTLRLHSG